MKYQKIIETLTKANEAAKNKEIKEIKKIKSYAGECWGNYAEYILQDGTKRRFDKLTDKQQQKTIKEQKEILTQKETKRKEKELKNKIEFLESLEGVEPLESLEICIDWTSGSIYGWQARAIANAETATKWEKYEGNRTGGCGYDKRSTASASVLNYIKPLFILICDKLEKKSKKEIFEYITRQKDGRDFIGYGFDFWGGAIGSFSGGVGFECHRANLKELGLECVAAHEGSREEFYKFERKTKKENRTK